MSDACADLLSTLSNDSLIRILKRASLSTIQALIFSYPQLIGARFLDALNMSVSSATFQFLTEKMARPQWLSELQVHQAEKEFIKMVHEDRAGAPAPTQA